MTATKQRLLLAGMSLFLFFGLVFALPAFAQINANTTGLTATAGAANYGVDQVSLPVMIGRIIDIVVGLTGIIVFLLFVYAGVIWMTAQGDTGKVEKARGILTAATIGLVIVLSAFAIANFVVTQLDNATNASLGGSEALSEPSEFD